MSLRKKTILTIVITFLVVMLLSAVFSYYFFLESFRKIEREEVREEALRFHHLLNNELEQLSSLTKDWASWDDSYNFIQSSDQEFIDSNLVDSTYEELGLSYLLFINKNQEVIYNVAYDLQILERVAMPEKVLSFFIEQSSTASNEELSGFFSDQGNLLFYSANPILTSMDEGPSRGALVFAKPFDSEIQDHFNESLGSDFTLEEYHSDYFLNKKPIAEVPEIYYDDHDPAVIRFFSPILDNQGNILFVLEQSLQRTIFQRGIASMRSLMIAVASAGLVATVISILALEKGFLSRLSKLSEGVKNFQSGNTKNGRIILPGQDELSNLSDTIYIALSDLSATQKELADHLVLEKLLVSVSSKFINVPLEKLDDEITQVLELIGSFAGVDRSYILKLRELDQNVMDNTHEWCSPGTLSVMAEMQSVDIRQFPWWLVQMQSGKSVFIEDVSLLPPDAEAEKAIFQRQAIQSIANIPLAIEGNLVGILGFDTVRKKIAWTDQISVLLEVVGSIFTNALDRKQNEKSLIESHKQQYRLNQITQAGIRKVGFESTCRSLSKQIKSLVGADNGLLILKQKNNEISAYLSGRKLKITDKNHPIFSRFLEVPPDQITILKEISPEHEMLNLEILGKTLLALPLVSDANLVGVAALLYDDHHLFSEMEKAICEQAAPQVTLAIVKNRALESVRRRSEELSALRATIADITSELEIRKLLQTILERAIRLMNADGGDFCVYEEQNDALRVVALSNMDNKHLNTLVSIHEGAAGKAASERKTIILEDYSNWDGRMDEYQGANIHSAMVSPLIIGDRLMGTVGLFHYKSERKFSKNDQHLLSLFAQHASIALDNAMLFEKIQELARIDEVTGLLNRRSFIERADYEVNRARRLDHSIAIAMIDLDNFKKVNDTFGHQTGDEVLKEVSRIMRENIRNIDIIGRYGGDETVILMPETMAEQALNAMVRIKQLLNDNQFEQDGQSFKVTASIGLAAYPKANATTEEMIAAADEAMYKAKKQGRNEVCFFKASN